MGMCGDRDSLTPIEVHVQTDGHQDSPMDLLVKVNGTIVEITIIQLYNCTGRFSHC